MNDESEYCFFIIQMLGSITETWDTTIEACPTGFNPGKKQYQIYTLLDKRSRYLSHLTQVNLRFKHVFLVDMVKRLVLINSVQRSWLVLVLIVLMVYSERSCAYQILK